MLSWLASLSIGDELSLFHMDLRNAPVGQAGQVPPQDTFGQSKYKHDVGLFENQGTADLVWANVDSTIYGA